MSEIPLMDREPWTESAACKGAPPNVMFPESSKWDNPAVLAAKQYCDSCPVVADCLEFALKTRQSHGVWGGKTEAQRASLLRQLRRKK